MEKKKVSWLDEETDIKDNAIFLVAQDGKSRRVSYRNLVKKHIPTKNSQLTNDSKFVSEEELEERNYASQKQVDLLASQKIDGAHKDEDGYLYLTSNGEVVEGPIGPFAGGSGGGSGSNNATLTVANTTGWLSKTISESEECEVSFSWTSVEGDFATGDGTANIKVNGSSKAVKNIAQGNVTLQLKEYLVIGANIVRIAISDIYGNTKTLSFSIERIAFSLTSPFDDTVVYENDITFPYIPTGAAVKVMQFVLDGTLIGSEEVTTTGRQQSFVIPMQSHGSHTFEVYFTAQINESVVESNHLYYDIMFKELGCNTKIIASSFNIKNVQQYYPVVIPWIAYSPDALSTDVQLCVNGEVVQELTVDRTKQTWTYRADAVGKTVLEIVAGDVKKPFELNVLATDIDVSAEENDLGLYLTSYGRSNNEAEPGVWNYGGISAEFNNFNFVSNGWMSDNEGNTVLRVNGDARLTIPYKIFASDFRTTGKTIEFEIATRDVLNYDSVMLSCMSGGRGIEITTQMTAFASEQSEISTKYKEEEHIRISFVVEKKSSNKLLYCYINGVLTRCCLYSDDDDFSQALPVDITFGSNDCTTDIYNVRVYDNDLTRYQMLDNWIADTQSGAEKKNRYDRNNIYDDYGNITIETLKKDVPYLVLICPVLPTFKGDKKTCSGYYIDPVHPERSFWFEDAQIDVQGTSSQYYRIKNIKAKFKNGFILEDGTLILEYQLNGAGVPTSTFTFKADVASSEGFLNVILAQLYNDLCPVKTPAQQDNPDVRQSIDGTPIVIFHDNGTGPVFYGKFNFNHDKGTPEVFGFEEGDESWEILQNGTDRVGFRNADFSGDDWKNDFEARYPENNTDTTRLAAFAAWIASTNTAAAADEELTEAVTYGDVTYTHDTAEYRLAKFKNELPEYACVPALVFYYLFTLMFLCIDQREKNAFPTWIARLMLWIILFYDADSSMGTDNKGNLAFDYWMEDIDFTDAGEPVFNGQNSVLWKNMRARFWDEITAEYIRLRTTLGADGKPLLSYETVIDKIKAHVGTWCEAIYNEDAYKKYIEAFVVDGDASYLPMLRGNKMEFIMWWLYNRFRYMDSLFATGTSMEKRIMIRAHAKANVTMTAYVNMYGRVYYNALMATNRMMRGQAYEFIWDATGAEDAVIGINDADMITDIGDLAPLLPETIDISKAIHLERLKFGDEAIINSNMTTVTLGNNVLLRLLDGRNCPNLTGVVDASGCTGLVEVYLEGTSITNLKLPNGGQTEIVHLPETITNLTLMNLTKLKELVAPSFANVSTLRLENVGNIVDTFEILESIASGSRVRLIGVEWNFDTAEEIAGLNNIITSMRGLDENGNNVDTPQISGTCHINTLTGAELNQLKALYPYLTIIYTTLTSQLVFMTWDGSEELTRETVLNAGNGIDPVTAGIIETPTEESTAQFHFAFAGWSTTPDGDADEKALVNVEGDRVVYAAFTKELRSYTVNFYNSETLEHSESVLYGNDATYVGIPTPEDDYLEFVRWNPEPVNITGDLNCYAQWYDTREISDDWETIAANCLNGTATDKYAIGSYKPVKITYEDGTSETIDFEVIGHNHDELTDNTNASWKFYNERTGIPIYSLFVYKGEIWGGREHPACYHDGKTSGSGTGYGYSTALGGTYAPRMVVYKDEIHLITSPSAGGDPYHYKYDFENNDWVEVCIMRENVPVGPHYCTYIEYNGLLYAFAHKEGHNGYYTFDGSSWSQLNVVTNLTRMSHLIVYDGKIHMFIGTGYNEHYTFDGSEWTYVCTAPKSMQKSSLFVYNGVLHAIGGTANPTAWYVFTGTEWIDSGMVLPFDVTGNCCNEIIFYNGHLIVFNVNQYNDLSSYPILHLENPRAPLTFLAKNVLKDNRQFHSSNEAYWSVSDLRKFCNGDLYNALPEDLQSAISEVIKFSDTGSIGQSLENVNDKVWICSMEEYGFELDDIVHGQGSSYPVFTNNNSRKRTDTEGTAVDYWSRTYKLNNGKVYIVYGTNGVKSDNVSNNLSVRVLPGFCI